MTGQKVRIIYNYVVIQEQQNISSGVRQPEVARPGGAEALVSQCDSCGSP
jgi:hypothetical protein